MPGLPVVIWTKMDLYSVPDVFLMPSKRTKVNTKKTKKCFWASGAELFIVRRHAFNEVGGLDEDFYAHMEEIDLCWRLKNRGYSIGSCRSSHVYHVGGGTLDRLNPLKTYLNFRTIYTCC